MSRNTVFSGPSDLYVCPRELKTWQVQSPVQAYNSVFARASEYFDVESSVCSRSEIWYARNQCAAKAVQSTVTRTHLLATSAKTNPVVVRAAELAGVVFI